MGIRNEYRLGIGPGLPGHLLTTYQVGEFEIEATPHWLEARASADGDDAKQYARATAVLQSLLAAFSLREQQAFSPKGRPDFAQLDTETGKRNITVNLEAAAILSMSAHADLLVKDASGNIITDSRIERRNQLSQMAHALMSDEILKRMVSFQLAYYADPFQALDHLYNVGQLAEKRFNGPKKARDVLRVSANDFERLAQVANNPEIELGRHPGRSSAPNRPPTSDERCVCERIANAIIYAYSAFVLRNLER